MSSSAAVKGSGDGGKGKAVASPVGAKKVDGSAKVVSISKQKSVIVASKQGVFLACSCVILRKFRCCRRIPVIYGLWYLDLLSDGFTFRISF